MLLPCGCVWTFQCWPECRYCTALSKRQAVPKFSMLHARCILLVSRDLQLTSWARFAPHTCSRMAVNTCSIALQLPQLPSWQARLGSGCLFKRQCRMACMHEHHLSGSRLTQSAQLTCTVAPLYDMASGHKVCEWSTKNSHATGEQHNAYLLLWCSGSTTVVSGTQTCTVSTLLVTVAALPMTRAALLIPLSRCLFSRQGWACCPVCMADRRY